MVNVLEAHWELLNLMCKYDQYLRNESGPMNKFWQQYLDMVKILFDFRKSVRNGNWNLHIAASERMLKWFFVYDCTNYSRHFTFYWASQLNLSQIHLSMLNEFQKDNFSVRWVPGKFNHLPSDQVIEQTVNRHEKGPGGIIGFSTTIDIDKPHCTQTDFTDGRFIATNQVRNCSERFSTSTSELC